jgi:hypothetical protein
MKLYCGICGKPKPPNGWSPWSNECDAGYSILLHDGKKKTGFCDSKRLGLTWPPEETKENDNDVIS